MTRTPPPPLGAFPHVARLQTRWMDNDLYGHVNNVVYYSYFDTLIAEFMIHQAGFDPFDAPVVGVAVETGCRFHSSIRYPEQIDAGLRVGRLGTTSVRWEIGIFKAGEPDVAAADGHFVHVFVDRTTQRPVPIPDDLRRIMTTLQR
ncbi:MAG: acyl-CoA thioesterase [Geminicoccaceae bacterium]|nr:MAG: acyl-CoA thioesterase [Geminicoccaceae bacterium]